MAFFRSFVPNAAGERDDFAPHESKSVPQRLKPSSAQPITARLNPCPSFDSLFPSLSGAVQIGQPKNLIWTGVKFSRPRSTSSGQALQDSIPGSHTPSLAPRYTFRDVLAASLRGAQLGTYFFCVGGAPQVHIGLHQQLK